MADAREEELKRELSDCVLNSSWFYCVAGVALAVPWGVRKKSYMPVVYLGLAGTLMDLINGYDKCKEQRYTLESYLRAKEAFGQQATSWQRQVELQQQQGWQEHEQQADGGRPADGQGD